MAAQPRSAETRQRIIDASVALFDERGYWAVGIAAISHRADATTGAFYYHFDSKEDLAMAIMGQGWLKFWSVVEQHIGSGEPGLETAIRMTFVLSDLMKRDRVAAMGHQFNLAFSQLGEEFRTGSQQRAKSFITVISDMIGDEDIGGEFTPDEVGAQVWMNLNGCRILSDKLADSATRRMELSWRLMLSSIATGERLARAERFLRQTAAQYD